MTTASWAARVGVAVAALALTAACGGSGGTVAGDPISEPGVADAVGRTYVSTGVTVDGEPWPLVEGSRIKLELGERSVGISGGCNGMGTRYELDGDRLNVDGEIASTLMGCDEALEDEDVWLRGLLLADPVLTVDGDRLTLTAGDTVVELVDEGSVVRDRTLRGTRWVLESYGGSQPDDSVSSVPVDVTSTLEMSRRKASVELGCNQGGGRLGVRDGRLLIRGLLTTAMACLDEDGNRVEHVVLTVLTADPAWQIDGDVLTLTSRAGTLTYRAGL